MEGVSLDNFLLPEVATDAFKRSGLKATRVEDGVDYFMSGHDKGVAYEFFTFQIKNEVKTKKLGYPFYDQFEMIRWYKDRFDKPVEKVMLLPEDLLSFDEDKVCVGGKYKAAYERFKSGLKAPGLALAKWNVLDDNGVATLTAMNIFSVEQFAETPRSKLVGKLPQDPFINAHDEAIAYVAGKDARAVTGMQSEKILAVSDENAKLKLELDAVKEQMKALMTGESRKSKKQGDA